MSLPNKLDSLNNSPLGDGSNKSDSLHNAPLGDGGKPYNMHYGADPILFEKAEELRAKMTVAEEIFWNAIKINEWHLKFRRQHPISIYIADFYCHAVKLVIEIDGDYHQQEAVKQNDLERENHIKSFGITVLRFSNEEILQNLTQTLHIIGNTIQLIKENHPKKVDSLNNSPLGDGGKKVDPSHNSPLGDGGGIKPKLFVIKIGGNIIDDESKLISFLKDLSKIPINAIPADYLHNSPSGDGGKTSDSLHNSPLGDGGGISAHSLHNSPLGDVGCNIILIHGGGKIATKIGDQLGIESKYINGRRITDAPTIDLVTMVYGGLINKKIVAKLQALGSNAIGLTGADGNIIPADKRPVLNSPLGDGGSIDYGFVGDVRSNNINSSLLDTLLKLGITPIIAPLTHDGNGQMLNTNADTIASTIAVALSKMYDVRLIYCFEKKGILENIDEENSVISLITKEKYQQLLVDKKLFDGILPKIDNAFAAIDNGVQEVLIGDAADLLQNTTEHTIGTLIK